MNGRPGTLAVFLSSVILAAWLAAGFEAGAWYQEMLKPDFTPPNWLYGPLWAVAYLFMALAAWRVWDSGHSLRSAAIIWWMLFLLLNVLGAWLMFELHRTGWAMASAALAVCFGLMCWRAFFRLSRPAAVLLIPPLLWAVFGLWLDYQFWSLNQGGLASLFGS